MEKVYKHWQSTPPITRASDSHRNPLLAVRDCVKMSSVAEVKQGYELFDPRAYLQNNYTHPRANFESEDCVVPWKLRCLVRGRTLLDIGSGPTIYQVISACEHFEEIILSDYLEVNRQELSKWLHGEPDAFDWSPYLKYPPTRGDSKAERLRQKVKGVWRCDVQQPNPLHPASLGPVDAITTTFCLEAVSADKRSLESALANVTTLLVPGGFLLMIGALDESYYLAGQVRIPVLPVDEEYVKQAVTGAGYRIRVFQTYIMPAGLKIGVDDVRGVFYLQAQKL
uniref:Phenylethanolamine N-methyltransferase n=1 Tax=Callorhinchus milii TaxID=7868 RepID=A0A4W3HME1_CALMI